VGQGNKDTKRDLGRNPFFKPGLFGPDQSAPFDWNARGLKNEKEPNKNFVNNIAKYGPAGNLTGREELSRQRQQIKLNSLKKEGNPWAMKPENQQYFSDTGPSVNGTSYTINGDATKKSNETEMLQQYGGSNNLTQEQNLLGRGPGAFIGGVIGTAIAPGMGTVIGAGLGAAMGNNIIQPNGTTQATIENAQQGASSSDNVDVDVSSAIGAGNFTSPASNRANLLTQDAGTGFLANQAGGLTSSTGIGSSSMQPSSALVASNDMGVEGANINGLDGNVDNPANDLVNQYKIRALEFPKGGDVDTLEAFRKNPRSNLGQAIIG